MNILASNQKDTQRAVILDGDYRKAIYTDVFGWTIALEKGSIEPKSYRDIEDVINDLYD